MIPRGNPEGASDLINCFLTLASDINAASLVGRLICGMLGVSIVINFRPNCFKDCVNVRIFVCPVFAIN